MKTFTDTAGRTWAISLNLGTAMAVKDKLGIDLLQPEAGEPPSSHTGLLRRFIFFGYDPTKRRAFPPSIFVFCVAGRSFAGIAGEPEEFHARRPRLVG